MRYNNLLHSVYPLELSSENRMTDNLQLLHQDKTLMSAIYLATHAVDDLRYNACISNRTQSLLCVILSSLNEGLHQPSRQQSSATMVTILILLFAAEALEDYKAVTTHLKGIGRLLMVRDHIPTDMDAKLLFKIQQFDLRLTLAFGGPLHLTLAIPGPLSLPIGKSGILQGLGISSPWVTGCFRSLQVLVQEIKDAMSFKTDLRWEDSQPRISTIQTQLLGLENGRLPHMDEALRLGMLAFLTTLSRSPVRRPQLPKLYNQFGMIYTNMGVQDKSYQIFDIWVMIMGFLSTIETSNSMVRGCWEAVVDPTLSWQTVREKIKLEDLPWIEFIHDEPAKTIFFQLQARRLPR